MISTVVLTTCTVFSNEIVTCLMHACTIIDCRPFFMLYHCVRSSVSMFVIIKLADNIKTTSYQRYQRRIQVDAA